METKEDVAGPAAVAAASDDDWSDIGTDDELLIDGEPDNSEASKSAPPQPKNPPNDNSSSAATAPGGMPLLNFEPETSPAKTASSKTSSKSATTPSSSRKKGKKKGAKSGGGGGSSSSRRKSGGEGPPSALDLPSDVFDAIAGAKGDNFNLRLDKAAKKMRLNRTQVKSVLRRLVESPEFVNLVLEKAGESSGSGTGPVEPRITRKLARTVVDSGGKLNWFLEKVSKTPRKVNPESLALMQEEFPEDEDDEDEWDPKSVATAASKTLSDDEDSLATASDAGGATPGGTAQGTPNSSLVLSQSNTPVTSLHKGSSSQLGFYGTTEAIPNSLSKLLDDTGADPIFKRPSQVVGSLNFEGGPSSSCDSPTASSEPRLTRSKASLKEVTIEELDLQFVPPDVTPDMYDSLAGDDDYTQFLAETFGYPALSTSGGGVGGDGNDRGDAGGGGGDPPDLLDLDPDFEYRETEEDPNQQVDEFKNNRSTKIPQKEVHALMQELFDAYELDTIVAASQEEPDAGQSGAAKKGKKSKGEDGEEEMATPPPEGEVAQEVVYAAPPPPSLDNEQRSLLAQQMRQHTQQLAQMALLSARDPTWKTVHQHAREMLGDLVQKSFNCPHSMFAQDNLFPSLRMVEKWETETLPATEVVTNKWGKPRYEPSPYLVKEMINETFWTYTNLLPQSALNPDAETHTKASTYWSPGEDQLIVLALEEAEAATSAGRGGSASAKASDSAFVAACKTVHDKFMKGTKTYKQIRTRFKNMTKAKLMESYDEVDPTSANFSVIRYYKKYKRILGFPGISEQLPYDPARLLPLRRIPPSLLPQLWRDTMKKMRNETDCEREEYYFGGCPSSQQPQQQQFEQQQLPVQQQIVIHQPVLTVSAADLQQLELTSQPVVMTAAAAPAQEQLQASSSMVLGNIMGFSMPNLISPMKEISLQPMASATQQQTLATNKTKLESEVNAEGGKYRTIVMKPTDDPEILSRMQKLPKVKNKSPKGRKNKKTSKKAEARQVAQQQQPQFVPIQSVEGGISVPLGSSGPMVALYMAPPDNSSNQAISGMMQPASTEAFMSSLPEIVDESGAQITILDAAMEECGIGAAEDMALDVSEILNGPAPSPSFVQREIGQFHHHVAVDGVVASDVMVGANNAEPAAKAHHPMEVVAGQQETVVAASSPVISAPAAAGNRVASSPMGQVASTPPVVVASTPVAPKPVAASPKVVAASPKPVAAPKPTAAKAPATTKPTTKAPAASKARGRASAAGSTKKTKTQRETETLLNTLQPVESVSDEAVRREHEAVEIMQLAKETLPSPALINFFETIVKMEADPAKAYRDLHAICIGHEILQETLLDILTPEQALSLGKHVYSQYCQRADFKRLLLKIRSSFPNRPGVQTRVLKELQSLLAKPDKVQLSDLKAFAAKTFKSNQVLCDEFLSLLPGGPAPPPDVMGLIQPEHIDMDDLEGGGDQPQLPVEVERIELELTEEEKLYGTDRCPCSCHPKPSETEKGAAAQPPSTVSTPHCIHCSIRFINGKVFLKDGKVLKPVSVEYEDGTTYESRNRAIATRKTVKAKRKKPAASGQ